MGLSIGPKVGNKLLLSDYINPNSSVMDYTLEHEVKGCVVETHNGTVGKLVDIVVLIVAWMASFAGINMEPMLGVGMSVSLKVGGVNCGTMLTVIRVVHVEEDGVVSDDGNACSVHDGGLRLVGSPLVCLEAANELSILDDTPLVRGRLCASLSKFARTAGLRKLAIRSPSRILPSISLRSTSSDIGHFVNIGK